MTTATASHIAVTILPNTAKISVGKLADVELHFDGDSPLAGLKLLGFAVWQRTAGDGLSVTFPSNRYVTTAGERRSFALLRPVNNDRAQRDRITDLILAAYAEHAGS